MLSEFLFVHCGRGPKNAQHKLVSNENGFIDKEKSDLPPAPPPTITTFFKTYPWRDYHNVIGDANPSLALRRNL